MIRLRWYLALMLIMGACTIKAGSAVSEQAINRIAWTRDSDFSLWVSSMLPSAKPRLLFGHGVLGPLVPSWDGRHIAAHSIPDGAAILLFDVQHPGSRHTIRLSSGEQFLDEWSADGSGVLVSRQSMSDERNLGVYLVQPNGQRKKLLGPPPGGVVAGARCAGYSPDKRILAVEGDDWFQLASVNSTLKTILFRRTDVEIGSGVPLTWIDNNRLVLAGNDRLVLVDVAKRTIKPQVTYYSIDSMVYSRSRDRLYVCMKPSLNEEEAVYAIYPATGQMQRVPLGNLVRAFSIYGLTANGKYAVISATDPSLPDPAHPNSGTTGIWAVDLDTGEHTLITKNSIVAAILRSSIHERAK